MISVVFNKMSTIDKIVLDKMKWTFLSRKKFNVLIGQPGGIYWANSIPEYVVEAVSTVKVECEWLLLVLH